MSISENIRRIRSQIPENVTLVAVSKFQPAEKVKEAFDAGQIDFGENKVQEMVNKAAMVKSPVRWHMIGHLQRNKVKYIAPFVHLIHGVDSAELLDEIEKQAIKNDRIIPVLLQMHLSGEESKFGLSEQELLAILVKNTASTYPHIEIRGLMGMAALTHDNRIIRSQFRSLKVLFDRVKSDYFPLQTSFTELSMGMSSDYAIAIEEGSTMIRIGTAIFGERQY